VAGKLHDEVRNKLYSSRNIVRARKSRTKITASCRMRENVEKCAQNVTKPERERHLRI
jgi:hypothetical protein